MDQLIAEGNARQNFNTLLLTVFASIALLLAAVGIYGLMSYAVEQRVQEIGIRMAIGADQGKIMRLVLGQGMRLASVGTALGLAGAYGLTRLLGEIPVWREIQRPSDIFRRRCHSDSLYVAGCLRSCQEGHARGPHLGPPSGIGKFFQHSNVLTNALGSSHPIHYRRVSDSTSATTDP